MNRSKGHVRLSVVICTFRRHEALALTLNGVCQQSIDQSLYEVLVIDNGCDHETRDQVHSFTNSIPNISYIPEPSIGLSYARNRGAALAKGEWVIYLDDDAVPEVDWLTNYNNCFEEISQPAVVGGPVLPVWPTELPSWLTEDIYPYLSLCNYVGDSIGIELDFPKQYPIGANVAYHHKILEDYGGFHTTLGRRDRVLLSGEETLLNYRVRSDGFSINYCPNAIVYHHIDSSRINRSFFYSRSFWEGRTKAIIDKELFGLRYLKRALFRKVIYEFLIGFLCYFYRGYFVRRNPILTKLHVREFFGYIVQGLESIFYENAE